MKLTEIQRAVAQCREQSGEMAERACVVVESCWKAGGTGCGIGGGTGLFEVMFLIARRWEELGGEEEKANTEQNNSGGFMQGNITIGMGLGL